MTVLNLLDVQLEAKRGEIHLRVALDKAERDGAALNVIGHLRAALAAARAAGAVFLPAIRTAEGNGHRGGVILFPNNRRAGR